MKQLIYGNLVLENGVIIAHRPAFKIWINTTLRVLQFFVSKPLLLISIIDQNKEPLECIGYKFGKIKLLTQPREKPKRKPADYGEGWGRM